MLELMAAVACFILIFFTRQGPTGTGSAKPVADRAAEYGSLIVGFLSDQLQQQEFVVQRYRP